MGSHYLGTLHLSAGHGRPAKKALILLWWRHQMETFSALLALCAGNSPVTGEFPSHRPAPRSFSVFFDLRLNRRLSKQTRRRWFETPSRSLLRHCFQWFPGRLADSDPLALWVYVIWYCNCRGMNFTDILTLPFSIDIQTDDHIIYS